VGRPPLGKTAAPVEPRDNEVELLDAPERGSSAHR
jgi:hypothetical protein